MGVGSRVGGGDGWGGVGKGVEMGKWSQLYLNNNKKNKRKISNKQPNPTSIRTGGTTTNKAQSK